jgi:glycosyltransferase involved in cell wall biosynthesis
VSSIEFKGSGITYCVTSLAEAQARSGAEPQVFSLGQKHVDRAALYVDRRYANDLDRVPILKKIGMSKAMKLALHAEKPEIVHTHGLWMLPNVYRTTDAAFIITPHGMLSTVALSFSPRKKRLFRLFFQDEALAAAALFHATAKSEYDDIRRFGLSQPVAIIPNGIDLPEALPLRASEKTVLSLGRIHPKKALDTLIRAWAKIESIFPDWSLQIVGPDEGGHAGELADLVRKLGLGSVSIEPPVFGNEKLALIARSDLFVLPSHSENFGITVAESLAAAVPVISSKGAPWAELETHRCGWWIDHGSEALAATLQSALSLPEAERRQMGVRGREWMARDFSWSRMAQMSLEAYEWVLGRGDRPTFVLIE